MKSSDKKDIRENTLHDQIARRAHELWEQDGYQHGNHAKHWEEAERQLFGPVPMPEKPAYPSPTARMTAENSAKDKGSESQTAAGRKTSRR